MKIRIIPRGMWYGNEDEILYLQQDCWDDFTFKTMFQAYYHGESVGCIKIGYLGMKKGQETFACIPREFIQLSQEYFSLWQSEESYENIRNINSEHECNLFNQLNDLAANLKLFDKYSEEEAVKISLFRSVSSFQCREQFNRIANGGSVLTEYRFSIGISGADSDTKLDFCVTPNEKPSSNIHVIIGRNGIGKTHLLKSVACNIAGKDNQQAVLEYELSPSQSTFANVLCVSFSPFDDYSNVIDLSNNPVDGYPVCSYIGLDRNNDNLLEAIEKRFLEDLKGCLLSPSKIARWKNTIKIINSDPVFAAINIGDLAEKGDGSDERLAITKAKALFGLLSSGHKCVLSLLTSCVNKLEEKSVVLIDEPENHLHPPLLSALIQALSYLLIDRNGVAIISTHSPVVLQEVPSACVWIINRSGNSWNSRRPAFETFGADIGSLTREVFGLEVDKSGYHRMIKKAVEESNSLDEVFELFNDNLGNEAAALANILWTQKCREASE